jgi:hypothetical protein
MKTIDDDDVAEGGGRGRGTAKEVSRFGGREMKRSERQRWRLVVEDGGGEIESNN